ncbi:MAG: hypothetical protein HY985_05630 [Magnetospirillum sp.]|nr:hypothetical protein [Magnetospirillum sp.]
MIPSQCPRHAARLAMALAATLAVAGCADEEGFQANMGRLGMTPRYQFFQLEALSLINTQKTITDHIATLVTGRDCSTPRAQREGVWCVDWPGAPPPPPQVYCYQSLARPSCYSQPYNEGNDRLIGFVAAPLMR